MPDNNQGQPNQTGSGGESQQAGGTQPQTGSSQDQSWKEDQTVPYERFEEVVRQKNDYKEGVETLKSEVSQIKEALQQSTLRANQTDRQQLGKYDKLAREAGSWQQFVNEMKEDFKDEFIQEYEKREAERRKAAAQELEQEVESLKRVSGLESDEEVDKVSEIANEMSGESGQVVSLREAYWRMKAEGKLPEGEDSDSKAEDRKEAAKKVQDSKRSAGGAKPSSDESYSGLQRKSLDDIIHEAKEELKQG